MFLTNEELEILTGYPRNADRCRWLENHKWIFERAATGMPIVSRAYAEARLSGQSATIQQKQPQLRIAAIRG